MWVCHLIGAILVERKKTAKMASTSRKSSQVTIANETLARNLTIYTTRNCSYRPCRSRVRTASTLARTLAQTETMRSKTERTLCPPLVTSIKACLSALILPCNPSRHLRAWPTPSISVRVSTTRSRVKSIPCTRTKERTDRAALATTVEICNTRERCTTARNLRSRILKPAPILTV